MEKCFCSRHTDFKVGDLERMWVISTNIFYAGKLSEMRVALAQCGWVHVYGNMNRMYYTKVNFPT